VIFLAGFFVRAWAGCSLLGMVWCAIVDLAKHYRGVLR